jgi:hypothetical protein
VIIAVGAVVAVLGAIMLLVAICLIIGAEKVSDVFMVLSTFLPFPRRNEYWDKIVKPPVPGSIPGAVFPDMYEFYLNLINIL